MSTAMITRNAAFEKFITQSEPKDIRAIADELERIAASKEYEMTINIRLKPLEKKIDKIETALNKYMINDQQSKDEIKERIEITKKDVETAKQKIHYTDRLFATQDYKNPTELGTMFNPQMSPHSLNKLLEYAGFYKKNVSHTNRLKERIQLGEKIKKPVEKFTRTPKQRYFDDKTCDRQNFTKHKKSNSQILINPESVKKIIDRALDQEDLKHKFYSIGDAERLRKFIDKIHFDKYRLI